MNSVLVHVLSAICQDFLDTIGGDWIHQLLVHGLLVAVRRHVDVLRHDTEHSVVCADAQARRTLNVYKFLRKVELLAEHGHCTDVANCELGYDFGARSLVVDTLRVGIVYWQAKDADANEHEEEGLQDVVVGVDAVAEDEVGVVQYLIITLRHLKLHLLQQAQPERVPELALLIRLLEAHRQHPRNVRRRHTVPQRIGVLNIH